MDIFSRLFSQAEGEKKDRTEKKNKENKGLFQETFNFLEIIFMETIISYLIVIIISVVLTGVICFNLLEPKNIKGRLGVAMFRLTLDSGKEHEVFLEVEELESLDYLSKVKILKVSGSPYGEDTTKKIIPDWIRTENIKWKKEIK
jgi:hypothetical protein